MSIALFIKNGPLNQGGGSDNLQKELCHLENDLGCFFSPYSSWGEKILLSCVALLLLIMVGIAGFFTFSFVDSAGVSSTKSTLTVVVNKETVPAYTTTILVGKVILPHDVPESYRIRFKIDADNVSVEVSKKFFDTLRIGDRIQVNYGFGRITNKLVPTHLKIVEGQV